jgi:catechol 2,3-dioxygenase-like lactoylglutathione lyase family enzyme
MQAATGTRLSAPASETRAGTAEKTQSAAKAAGGPLIPLLIALLMTFAPAPGRAADEVPVLLRIQVVTVATDDVPRFRALYERWLDYEAVESGQVAPQLARSWGAPASAGRDYVLLRSAGTPDVMLRVVDVDVPRPHEAMTTFGWSVIEFLVQDPDAVYERLLASPFRHIGGPANLGGGTSSIRATQFVGPAAVASYFTADTAPQESAFLPRAKSFIGRPFIIVLATPDADTTDRFYRETFQLGGYAPQPTRIGVVNAALGLADDHETPLGLATGAEAVNAIEIDGYPEEASRRPRAPGQLPPAIAMVSFAVKSLDGLDIDFIEPPAPLYGDRRAATFIGPAGELTELIEFGPEGR